MKEEEKLSSRVLPSCSQLLKKFVVYQGLYEALVAFLLGIWSLVEGVPGLGARSIYLQAQLLEQLGHGFLPRSLSGRLLRVVGSSLRQGRPSDSGT